MELGILLFIIIFVLILLGYPVALTLAGVSVLFGIVFVPDFLDLLPLRIMGTMQNYVLIAVPLFIYMGLVVGALLAASTGIVGATVITMGLISLPVMLKKGYKPELATGVIASSGTLGQIGSVLGVSAGDLFSAAVVPGVVLVVSYVVYILVYSRLFPGLSFREWLHLQRQLQLEL